MTSGIHSAHASGANAHGLATELSKALAPAAPKIVVFFHGKAVDGAALSRELERQLPGAQVAGCSTCGEFTDQSYTEGGVVALALGEDRVARSASALARVDGEVHEAIGRAGKQLREQVGMDLRELDPARWVGLVLVDGALQREELVNEALGNLAPQLSFVGGSAGDDLAMERTWVHGSGESSPAGAALLLLELRTPHRILKTCNYLPTEKVLTVGRVAPGRIVMELDGGPAAEVYARAIDVPVEKLDHGAFLFNPLGLMIDGKPWLRSMVKTTPDGGIFFACEMKEGMRMHVMRATDIVEDTRQALERTRTELGQPIAGALLFNCAYRKLELGAKQSQGPYFELFKPFATAGFHTHGESWLGHINQTLTGLVFA